MNRKFLKRAVYTACCAVVIASCTTTPSGRSQLILKSEAALELEGARQSNIIRETVPLVNNRDTIDYVACVVNAIVDELDGPAADMYWELAIVDQPDVNAYVLPGGKIVVKAGLLSVTANQDQLAAVIGHEVAHVTSHHSNERASRAAVTGFGIDVAAILLGGPYGRNTNAAYGALSTGVMFGLSNPFSRKQESEADLIGLEYMAMAGFDPRESVELWKNMNAANTSRIPEFLSTHPSGDTRIDDLVSHYAKTLALYNQAQAEGKYPDCQR